MPKTKEHMLDRKGRAASKNNKRDAQIMDADRPEDTKAQLKEKLYRAQQVLIGDESSDDDRHPSARHYPARPKGM